MFKELKNVLKPRAKQWEEREAKALGVPSSTDRVDTAQSLDDVNTSSSEHNDQPSLNPLLNPTSECNNQAKEEQAVVDDADAIKHELKNVFEWSSSSSIAAMVAQQSKMLNLSTCQEGSVFAFDGDASCDEDSSDSEGS